MACEDTLKVSNKIRIYPNEEQKNLFRQWIGTYRYVYNKTLEIILQLPRVPNWKQISLILIKKLPFWAKAVPFQIKKMAIKEACNALSTQKKICMQTGKQFEMHFKSVKKPIQSCYIPKSAISSKGIYHTLSENILFKESLPKEIHDGRLVMTNGKFYLCVPTTRNRLKAENQGRVIAIDPGMRKFITFISHDKAGCFAKNDVGRIYRLCYYLDKLISKKDRIKSEKRKRRYNTAANRIRIKIRNLITELHNKVAKFLVDNFDIIILPKFETQEMVNKASRKINSKSVRAMMTYSHYKFKQRLKHKAFEYGKLVIDVTEEFTSKTNNFTGEINNKLGSKDYIKVNGKRIDRDINGALGIFLKALVDTPNLKNCLNCIVNKS